MERNRSKKAKSLRAAGRKPVKTYQDTYMVPGRELVPSRNFGQTIRFVRRFVQNGSVINQAFTLGDGHSQFLSVYSAAGNASPIVDSWRIRKIRLWLVAQSNSSPSCTLTPVGTDLTNNMNNDRESIYTCTSRSTAEPVSMSIIPSINKPLGSWHFTSATNSGGSLFQLNVNPNGSALLNMLTMEIEFEAVLNWVGTPLGYTRVTATTQVGVIGGENILLNMSLVGVNNLG